MKYCSPFFFMNLVLLSSSLWALDATPLTSKLVDPDGVKPAAIESQTTTDESKLLLFNVPGVKEKYEECKASLKADGIVDDAKEIPKCIWEGRSPKVAPLDDDKKKQVQAEYQKTQKISDGANVEKKDLTLTSAVISTTHTSDPGYKKLAQIIDERLYKALHGSNTDKTKIAEVDHTKFNDLYKSEISKGIVDVLTSYCLKVDLSPTAVQTNSRCIAEKKCSAKGPNEIASCEAFCKYYTFGDNNNEDKTNEENNLKTLNTNPNNFKIAECIVSVPAACTDSGNSGNKKAQQMACTVDDYLRSAKKNLVLNEEFSNFYKGLEKSTSVASNFVQVEDMNKEQTLTVTSNDVEKAFKDENIALKKISDECIANPNQDQCKKLLDTNLADKEKNLTEFGLRQFAQEKELETAMDPNNKTDISDYLLKQGYTKDQITALMNDQRQLDLVKQEIKDKFRTQKDALINELSDRIKGTTSTVDGKIGTSDVAKINQISTELASKTDNLKKLVRFNNIASAYLQVGDKAGRSPSSKTTSNTASLNVELSADANNPDNKEIKNKKEFQKTGKAEDATIDVETIIQILGI